MKTRLIVVLVGDVAIATTLLILVLTRTAQLVPVGITGMICGVSFNYLVLRKVAARNRSGGPEVQSEASFEDPDLRKLAVRLAGIGGVLLIVGGLITLFATPNRDAIVRAIIGTGFGFYFIRVYLDNR